MQAPNALKLLLTPIVALGSLTLVSAAQAGKAVVSAAEGSAIFEYQGDSLRIGSADISNYVVVKGGDMYVVSTQGGQPMVIDAGAMLQGMVASGTNIAPSALSARIGDLEATGRRETVAGIDGEVYLVSFTDDQGQAQREEVVLSTDPLALEFRDALFSMASLAEQFADQQSIDTGRDLQQRLNEMDAGVLRYGSEMSVTSLSGETVAAERFALPAAPMDMQGLGNMLRQLSEQMPQQGSQ
jgi:hypothetical protein